MIKRTNDRKNTNLINKRLKRLDNPKGNLSDIEQQVEFFKFCHNEVSSIKNSVYQRASIIIVVLAFVVSAHVSIWIDIFSKNNIPENRRNILLVLFVVFLLTFLLTTFYAIRCLIPVSSKAFKKMFLQKYSSEEKKRLIEAHTSPKAILKLKYLDYKQCAYKVNTPELILEELIHGNFSLSEITDYRYNLLNISYICLSANIIAFVFTLLFYFIHYFTG